MHENKMGTVIVDCAVHLHQGIGRGLLESVYQVTLARKLGYLLNFGAALIKDGITRTIDGNL